MNVQIRHTIFKFYHSLCCLFSSYDEKIMYMLLTLDQALRQYSKQLTCDSSRLSFSSDTVFVS
jgi:hypothetical protein